jgi:hypothetical protein
MSLFRRTSANLNLKDYSQAARKVTWKVMHEFSKELKSTSARELYYVTDYCTLPLAKTRIGFVNSPSHVSGWLLTIRLLASLGARGKLLQYILNMTN